MRNNSFSQLPSNEVLKCFEDLAPEKLDLSKQFRVLSLIFRIRTASFNLSFNIEEPFSVFKEKNRFDDLQSVKHLRQLSLELPNAYEIGCNLDWLVWNLDRSFFNSFTAKSQSNLLKVA